MVQDEQHWHFWQLDLGVKVKWQLGKMREESPLFYPSSSWSIRSCSLEETLNHSELE